MRTETTTRTLYKYDELSEKAKEVALEWLANGALDYEWWDSTYEDAERIGLKLLEFGNAKFISSAEETAHLIEKKHGEKCETFIDAKDYLKKRDDIINSAERDEHGEIVDEYTLDENLEELDAEFLKTLQEDYRIILQKESEYLTSRECLEESMRANEYEFTEDGKVA